MYHFVYQTRCLINGKIYIGVHSTNDLNDGYLGSGKALKKDIKAFGPEAFERTVLQLFSAPQDMYAKEAELVNQEFIEREDTYNLILGGGGGFSFINSKGLRAIPTAESTEESRAKARKVFVEKMQDPEFRQAWEARHKAGVDQYMATNPTPKFLGCSHTEEAKRKIGENSARAQQGQGNSQFGTRWITNGKDNKKIGKQDPIEAGWRAGRTISYSW